jgi:hypothetical protein
MFSFCDVILHNKAVIRGAFIYSANDEAIYLFSRKPVKMEGLKIDGYVTIIPEKQISHVRFFASVYLYERISALTIMSDKQKNMIVQEMHRFIRERELVGMQYLLDRITVLEMMILLTEIEHDKYIVTDGQIIRFVNDEPFPINFNDPSCLSWLITSYMAASVNMESASKEAKDELEEYRKVFYEMSYEEIKNMNFDT